MLKFRSRSFFNKTITIQQSHYANLYYRSRDSMKLQTDFHSVETWLITIMRGNNVSTNFGTNSSCPIFETPHGKTNNGKPTICICENKDADQLRGNREADHSFVFATWIVQFLFYLYPKFQASSTFLCLCSSVCVRPVRKPHCWFSHEAAHLKPSSVALYSAVCGGIS